MMYNMLVQRKMSNLGQQCAKNLPNCSFFSLLSHYNDKSCLQLDTHFISAPNGY